MFAPLLTEFDPADSAEGGLDPLGLYAIADSLGVRLVPGVRERMKRIRFLTAIAVSSIICSQFDDDTISTDQSIEPYLVFEMHLVEGLVYTCWGEQIQALPGSLKAERAISAGGHLHSASYLKNAFVFGFHGVYKNLAEKLDIVKAGRLGEKGYELINTWISEEGLPGFYGATDGPGWSVRQQLVDAVREGIPVSGTDRSGGWSGWTFFKNHLHPDHMGKKESELLARLMIDDSDGFRGEVIRFLASPEGKELWELDNSERALHNGLRKGASGGLLELMDAISSYENFARLLTDAFYDCLFLMSGRTGKVSPKELAQTNGVKAASEKIPEIYPEVSTRLGNFGEAIRFETNFSPIAQRLSPSDWVQVLLSHHKRVQRQKPPNGKNPWFETFDDGSVVIRPLYRTNHPPLENDEYVHGYRTFALVSFCKDLGLI